MLKTSGSDIQETQKDTARIGIYIKFPAFNTQYTRKYMSNSRRHWLSFVLFCLNIDNQYELELFLFITIQQRLIVTIPYAVLLVSGAKRIVRINCIGLVRLCPIRSKIELTAK